MNQLTKSLCRFAREGNHFLAADLLDEGADSAKFDSHLWTPLHYACDRGHHAMVKLFLMKDPNINILDYVPHASDRISHTCSIGENEPSDGGGTEWALHGGAVVDLC